MNHDEARVSASLVMDEPLERERERDLAVHLVSCRDCREFYDGIRRARGDARSTTRRDVSGRLVDHSVARARAVLRGDPDPGILVGSDDGESTGEIRHTPSRDGATLREATEPIPAVRPDRIEPGEPRRVHRDGSTPFDDLGPAGTSRRERRAQRRDDRSRPRRGPWILAIGATLVLAAAAALLVVNGGEVRERLRPSLPDAPAVRQHAIAAFDDIRTLKTSYRISRLGLYRQPGDKIVYAFTNGIHSGRIVFESPDRLREEHTVDVPGQPKRKSTTVVRDAGVDVQTQDAGVSKVSTVTNAPFGPPDGALVPRIGVLEPSVTSVLRLLATARDLQVTGRPKIAGHKTVGIRFPVAADGFTRADRIDMVLDERTWLPLRIERTISRGHAGVLGPKEVLAEAAIDAQFAGRDRIASEVVELDGLTVNDQVLQGEFVMSPAEGQASETTDARWQRSSRGQIDDTLAFDPVYPSSLPSGYREAGIAMYTGKPQAWGPRKTFPAPDGAMQEVLTDGKITIVLSERRIARNRDRVTGSPLQTGDLQVTTEQIVRSGRQFEYGISSDSPPHVYGFIGDIYVIVSGYTTRDDLLRVVASLGTPAAPASPASASPRSGSPSPSASTSPTGPPARATSRP